MSNPFQNLPEQNPYSPSYQVPKSGFGQTPPSSAGDQLNIPAITLIVLASLMLAYGIFNMVIALAAGLPAAPQNQPPGVEIGRAFGFYGAVFGIPIYNLLVLIGSIMMLRRKSYAMAMMAAVMASIPICTPCVILGCPFGIWALVLLMQPPVKATF